MCGFAGCLTPRDATDEVLRSFIEPIAHRGPDDRGIWSDPESGIGLAHARLSIVDLSCAGHQPMVSGAGRFVISYNGEIYNHCALRTELERGNRTIKWRGHSDTETLLAGFDAWGIEETVRKAVGMFAFAVWDRERRDLTLVRDRIGEKPMYYGWQGDVFLFGSELSALETHPSFRAEIDRDALALLLRHNYVPAPRSIYKGINKQLPGTLVTVSLRSRDAAPKPYWDISSVMAKGLAEPFAGTPEDATELLDQKLRDAVLGQMMGDVPVGALLSGGIDSSTIVAIMQDQSRQPVRTFTIGFHEAGFNEAAHAKRVAEHLGTAHTELYVTPKEAQDVIPQLPRLYSEPFADSSQIPTFLVSQLARTQVTVSLSGDGGDELFAGYNRYALTRSLWGHLSRLPLSPRRAIARMAAGIPAKGLNRVIEPFQSLLPSKLAQANAGDKFLKGAQVMGARTPAELYDRLVSHWTEPERVVIGANESASRSFAANRRWKEDGGIVHEMMLLDILTYLPDDILVKVDRAAMAVSLETRVPLLDHRIVEFASKLPLEYKLRDGITKWPLRRVLDKYVPRQLIQRPKMGFGIPIGAWLRGPLKEWADDLLSESSLLRQGYFHPTPIRRKWEEHLSGARNWEYQLWNVLMFQAWLAEHG